MYNTIAENLIWYRNGNMYVVEAFKGGFNRNRKGLPGVASSIPARYHTFVENDHEIISTVILLLPLIYSRRVVVSYKRKYVHKLLVNRLLKPAQEKSVVK